MIEPINLVVLTANIYLIVCYCSVRVANIRCIGLKRNKAILVLLLLQMIWFSILLDSYDRFIIGLIIPYESLSYF